MVHKKSPVTIFSFLLVSLLFVLAGCQDNGTNSSPAASADYSGDEYTILDKEDAMNMLQEADEEMEFAIDSPGPGEEGFRRHHPPGPGRHLGYILRKLELTEVQRDSVKTFLEEHRSCMEGYFEEFREAVKPILDSANVERETLIAGFENGEMNRGELREALRDLRESTRETIKNSEEVQLIQAGMCDCRDILFENIGSVLTEDQSATWDEWLSGLDGPCS